MAVRMLCSVEPSNNNKTLWKMFITETRILMAHIGFCTIMGFAVQLPTYLLRIADSINGVDDNFYWEKYVDLSALNDTSDREMDEQILRGFKDVMAWWVTGEYIPEFDGRHVHLMFLDWINELASEGYQIENYPYDLSDMDGVDMVATYLFALGRMTADATAIKRQTAANPTTLVPPDVETAATSATLATPTTSTNSLTPAHPDNPGPSDLPVAQSSSSRPVRQEGVIVPPLPARKDNDDGNEQTAEYYLWGLPIPPAPKREPIMFTNAANPTIAEIKVELTKVARTLANMRNLDASALAMAREGKIASAHRIEALYALRSICRDVGHPFPVNERLHEKYRDRYPSVIPNTLPVGGTSIAYQPPSPPPAKRPRSRYVSPPPAQANPTISTHPVNPNESEQVSASSEDSDGPDGQSLTSEDSDDPDQNSGALINDSDAPDEDSDAPDRDSDAPDSDLEAPDRDSDYSGTDGSTADVSHSDDSMDSEGLLGSDGTYGDPGYELIRPRESFAQPETIPHLADIGMDRPDVDRD
ncbi:hypothetical protein CPC08DRAFT_769775 [Agrocybe pediades]|nr:hypothetical protein CPC08DRAFT_769775 [Agrocybe pediades]